MFGELSLVVAGKPLGERGCGFVELQRMERNAFGKPGGNAAGEIGEHVLARGLVIHRQDVAEPRSTSA